MQAVVKSIIPPLLPKFHKGQLGRVLVVGGCEDYTGAPFFAAMSALLTGADMSHIVCTKRASVAIKALSPDLMVHPYLNDEGGSSQLSVKVESLLQRVHVVLIGPGLGRDQGIFNQVIKIIGHVDRLKLPLIIDADGLFLVQQQPQLVQSLKNSKVILTPNVMEYFRLQEAVGIKSTFEESLERDPKEVARALNVRVVKKGTHDVLASGDLVRRVEEQGGLRRVSGQGDILSGAIAAFVGWAQAYEQKLWDAPALPAEYADNVLLVAMYGASSLVRRASRLAFESKRRAMVTTDVLGFIGTAFEQLYVEEQASESK